METTMLSVNRQMVTENLELLPEIEKEARATLNLCRRCKKLLELRKYCGWDRFEWPVLCEMLNDVDEPFVKVMVSLGKNGYKYSAVSMHKWWRRIKAVNQQHLITYFSYIGFPKPSEKNLFWTEVYAQCCKTSEVFERMSEVFRDDRSVEMNLRALMGISQNRDIKEAWTEWAKKNHPDKGGSVEKFVLVKAAYEEWNR